MATMAQVIRRIAPIVLGVWCALLLTGGDRRPDAVEQPIALTVRPQIMMIRGDIRVQVRIPRDVDNRRFALAWDSDGGSVGETQRQMDGDDAPALYVIELPSQPSAHYVFVATVYGQRGEARGHATAEILTPGG